METDGQHEDQEKRDDCKNKEKLKPLGIGNSKRVIPFGGGLGVSPSFPKSPKLVP